MLSTVSIPVSLLEIDIPQKMQTPVDAELDLYAVKSQNETQFPERGALIYRKVALGAGPWVQIIRKTRMICSPARMNHPTLSKSLHGGSPIGPLWRWQGPMGCLPNRSSPMAFARTESSAKL